MDKITFNEAYDIVKHSKSFTFETHVNENKIDVLEVNQDGYSLINAAFESESVLMLEKVIHAMPDESPCDRVKKCQVMTKAFSFLKELKPQDEWMHEQAANMEQYIDPFRISSPLRQAFLTLYLPLQKNLYEDRQNCADHKKLNL